MANNKKSFLLYCDLIHTVNQLPDDKAGLLLKHILSYVNDENPQTDDIIIKIAFEPLKQQLKRDLIKFEAVCDRNKTNGALGGRPKNNPTEPKKPSGLIDNPTEPKKPDSDNDNDNDIIKESIDFDALVKIINRIGNRNFTTISKSVKDKYRKLLTEGYTKEQVVKAIKNAYADDFHKESNFKYLTLEYFSRPKSIDLFGFKEEKFIPNPITDSLYD